MVQYIGLYKARPKSEHYRRIVLERTSSRNAIVRVCQLAFWGHNHNKGIGPTNALWSVTLRNSSVDLIILQFPHRSVWEPNAVTTQRSNQLSCVPKKLRFFLACRCRDLSLKVIWTPKPAPQQQDKVNQMNPFLVSMSASHWRKQLPSGRLRHCRDRRCRLRCLFPVARAVR